MKYKQSFAALFLMLILSTGLLANSFGKTPDCRVEKLNQTMRVKLNLSPAQMQNIQQLNHTYCSSRDNIWSNPEKVGRNTALLVCWDRWVQGLSQKLTPAQMEGFMQWQAGIDVLSEIPF